MQELETPGLPHLPALGCRVRRTAAVRDPGLPHLPALVPPSLRPLVRGGDCPSCFCSWAEQRPLAAGRWPGPPGGRLPRAPAPWSLAVHAESSSLEAQRACGRRTFPDLQPGSPCGRLAGCVVILFTVSPTLGGSSSRMFSSWVGRQAGGRWARLLARPTAPGAMLQGGSGPGSPCPHLCSQLAVPCSQVRWADAPRGPPGPPASASPPVKRQPTQPSGGAFTP